MTLRYTVGQTVQLDLEVGDSETFYVQWRTGSNPGVPVDLTGWTASLLDKDGDTIPCNVSIPEPTDGYVILAFTALQTAVMTEQYFRLRVNQGGTKQTLLEGRINLT